MEPLIVSAPGRLCLFGEHMDWCRRAVLAVAIDMRVFVQARCRDDEVVEVRSYAPFERYSSFPSSKPDPNHMGDLRYVHGVVEAYRRRGVYLKGIEMRFLKADETVVKLRSRRGQLMDLPARKGLSSSAAVCVATSAVVDLVGNGNPPEGRFLQPERLSLYAELAYTAERKILGVNCGQMDPYASAFGGILRIDCYQEPAQVYPLKPTISLPLVIGDTMQTKHTSEILNWLGKRFESQEPLFMEGIESITSVVEEASKELMMENPCLEKIGELMNLNQLYLSKNFKVSGNCPISPSRLDIMIQAAIDAGALGAKLSGSGGGGAMVALCAPNDVGKVARAIEEVGGRAYITQVSESGLRIDEI